MADGHIRIDFDVGSDKAVKDINAIKKSLDGLKDRFKNLGNSVESAFTSTSVDTFYSKMAKSEEAIRRQEIAVEKLENRMEKQLLSEVKKREDEIAELERFGKGLYKSVESLADEYVKTGDKKYYDIAEQQVKKVNEVRKKVKELKTELETLKANSELSKEFAILAQEIELGNDKLQRMKSELKDNEEKFNEVQSASKNATTEISKGAEKSTSMFEKMGNKMQQTLNRIKRIALSAFVFNVIRKGLSQLNKFLQANLMQNKQFANSMAQVKGNLLVAFAPIYDAVLPALNAMAKALATVTSHLASFTSALFGKTVAQSKKSAKAIYSNASAINATSKAMKKASKETKKAERSLASFDKLNILSAKHAEENEPSGAGGGSTALTPQFEQVEPKQYAWLDEVKEKLIGLKDISLDNLNKSLENLKDAMSKLGRTLFDGLLWAIENIFVPLAQWTAEMLLPTFLDLLASVINVLNVAIKALQPLGKWLWDKFLEPLARWTGGVIIGALESLIKLFDKLADWITENPDKFQNFAIVLGSIAIGITSVFTAVKLFKGIKTAIITLVTAFAGLNWHLIAIGVAIGAVIAIGVLLYKNWDTIREKASALGESISQGLRDLGEGFRDVARITGELFVELGKIIVNALKWVLKWLMEVFTAPVRIGILFVDGVAFILKKVVELGGKFGNKIEEGAKKVWSNIVDIVKGIPEFFGNLFSTAWGFVTSIWQGAGNWFGGVWEGIKAVFRVVPDWFKNVFSDAWQRVKNVFSTGGAVFVGIKDGILNGLKEVINALIVGINKVISIPFNGLNKSLQAIKSISIVGTKPFSFLPQISVPSIPRLATGAVIPPNKEFMAVLGDQKRGVNIETPLETMVQAFKTALSSGDYGKAHITIPIVLDSEQIYKTVVEYNNGVLHDTSKSQVRA